MLWKHLTAMAFSNEIGDCPPDPNWYEEQWLKWNPKTNNCNLEIAMGLGYKIPMVVPYEAELLPETARAVRIRVSLGLGVTVSGVAKYAAS